MHGSPLLRTIVITLVLLAAAAPLRSLTRATSARIAATAAAEAPAGAGQGAQMRLAVAFSQKPLRFEIIYLGKTLWQEEAVQAVTEEKTVAMAYPKEGVDLEYKVQWPPGTPLAAARLTVAQNEEEPVVKTLWGTGQADDILSFP